MQKAFLHYTYVKLLLSSKYEITKQMILASFLHSLKDLGKP